MATTHNHTVYNNFVLANKFTDLLTTHINMNNYMTLDTSLTETAGMKKKINTYTATGNVEDLTMGKGNTGEISVSFTTSEYTVGVTQGKFQYYDEQAMTDPAVVEMGLKAMSEKMSNDLTAKAITEYGKATLKVEYETSVSFDTIVDAIAKLNTEDESGLYMLINPEMKASLRKTLKDDLKYNSDIVTSGYIGSVAGVPIIVSKAVPENTAFVAKKEAVTCYIKKTSEIEQERKPDTRDNVVYARKIMVVALTDATKAVKIVKKVTQQAGS